VNRFVRVEKKKKKEEIKKEKRVKPDKSECLLILGRSEKRD